MTNYTLKTEIMKKYGSQIAFASELGISEGLLSKIVRGWRPATRELRKQIARKLGIEEQEIFPGDADEN
jgi:hypothetical protein